MTTEGRVRLNARAALVIMMMILNHLYVYTTFRISVDVVNPGPAIGSNYVDDGTPVWRPDVQHERSIVIAGFSSSVPGCHDSGGVGRRWRHADIRYVERARESVDERQGVASFVAKQQHSAVSSHHRTYCTRTTHKIRGYIILGRSD